MPSKLVCKFTSKANLELRTQYVKLSAVTLFDSSNRVNPLLLFFFYLMQAAQNVPSKSPTFTILNLQEGSQPPQMCPAFTYHKYLYKSNKHI